jgi:hypothetical protein
MGQPTERRQTLGAGRHDGLSMNDAPNHLPATLPDLLAPGLRLVVVEINPSLYSVAVGHYHARPGNDFWKLLA